MLLLLLFSFPPAAHCLRPATRCYNNVLLYTKLISLAFSVWRPFKTQMFQSGLPPWNKRRPGQRHCNKRTYHDGHSCTVLMVCVIRCAPTVTRYNILFKSPSRTALLQRTTVRVFTRFRLFLISFQMLRQHRNKITRNTYEGRIALQIPTFSAFIVLEKAFNKVNSRLLFEVLKKKGIGWKYRKIILNLYEALATKNYINGSLQEAKIR